MNEKKFSEKPLTYKQINILNRIEKNQGVEECHIPYSFDITGSLDVEKLEFAINEVVRKHPVLQSEFIKKNGQYHCFTNPDAKVHIEIKKEFSEKILFHDVTQLFDIAKAPLIQCLLYVLEEGKKYVLLINMFHLIVDGWSSMSFVRQFQRIYLHLVEQTPSQVTQSTFQIYDYDLNRRQYWETEEYKKKLAVVSEKYQKLDKIVFPVDQHVPITSYLGRVKKCVIDPDLFGSIDMFLRHKLSTLNNLMLFLFGCFFQETLNRKDISMKFHYSNRNSLKLFNMMGDISTESLIHLSLTGDYEKDFPTIQVALSESIDEAKICPNHLEEKNIFLPNIEYNFYHVPPFQTKLGGADMFFHHVYTKKRFIFDITEPRIFIFLYELHHQFFYMEVIYPPEVYDESTIENILSTVKEKLLILIGEK